MTNLPYISFLQREVEELFDTPKKKLFFLGLYCLVLFQAYLVAIYVVGSVEYSSFATHSESFENVLSFASEGDMGQVLQASSGGTYYVSPDGNDNGDGSANNPWKTFRKANSEVTSGDTVIVRDGVFNEYVRITVSGTTWQAENKHAAIIDGGFGPSLLNGSWNGIVGAWDRNCGSKGHGEFGPLVLLDGVSDVTLDGLFIRNSCGRGVAVFSNKTSISSNVKLTNLWIDWTFVAGVFAQGETDSNYPNNLQNFQLLNSILTRVSFNDQYKIRAEGQYGVNIAMSIGGVNPIVQCNLIAWGRGEVTFTPGSQNGIFENNVIVGNKNNFYANHVNGATIRNNLFYAPEGALENDSHMVPVGNDDIRDWHIGTRNEEGTAEKYKSPTNRDLAFYNNIFVNNSVNFSGYNRNFASDTLRVYFGHNTVIAGEDQDKILIMRFNYSNGAQKDPVFSAVVEGNIFDRRKSPTAVINGAFTNNDSVTLRNNIWPTNAPAEVRGPGDIYTNEPGLSNALADLNFAPPKVGVETVDVNEILTAFNINNYRLTAQSVAINKGTIAASTNETPIPTLVREQDYIKSDRVGIPDIGAFEYGEGTINPPFCFSTPIVPPDVEPPFIPPIYCSEPILPPPIGGPPSAPAGCGELGEMGLVDVTCPQYGADPTCTQDSTAAIQKAMNDAYKHDGMVTFFPPGVYCVSGTLVGEDYSSPQTRGKSYELVGSTAGAPPIIRLKANSNGFNNPNSPKPVIWLYTLRGREKEGSEIGSLNTANGFMESIRNLDIEVEEGNAGAVGVSLWGAQNNSILSVRVRLKSGFSGFNGMPGDNSALSDIEVVGGKHGISNSSESQNVKWPTMTNVRLYDQTDAAITNYGGTNWMISGLHIRKASGPAIVPSSGTQTSENITILDGKIEFTGQSQEPAIKNGRNKAIALQNVYFNNVSTIIQSPQDTVSGGSGWRRVETYGYPGQGKNMVNGEVSSSPYNTGVTAAAPPENLLSRHSINPVDYPSPDVILGRISAGDRTVANVWDHGIFPTQTGWAVKKYGVGNHTNPDVTDKLQSLINSGVELIFFPRGKYVVSRTIEMRENTHFIGIANQSSGLVMSDNWKPSASNPATMIRTPNSPTASPKMSFFRVLFRTDPPNDHSRGIVHVQSGKTVFLDTAVRPNLTSNTQNIQPNIRILMNNNAGGKFYGLSLGANEPRNQHKGYRHLLIEGTTNPLVMYGPNPEDHDFYGKVGGWGMEIKDASNVAIYGSKTENHNTLLVQNSKNIALLSVASYDNVNVINTEPAIGSFYPKGIAGHENQAQLVEVFNGRTNTIAKKDEIGIFVRGKVNFDSLLVSDDYQGGGTVEPPSPPLPTDIECSTSAVPGLSTQPCSVYKEFKIVNTGNNRNWRVTGEDAAALDAQQFLPNPVLDITVDDLEGAVRAEVLLDMWGGHDGTQQKRIRINENDWINIPTPRFELPADNPSTRANESDPNWYLYQMNPIIDIPLSQLKQGINTIEGNAARCGNGTCIGWPQWGMNAVMVRVFYDPAVKSGPAGAITFPLPNATINEYQAIHVAAQSDVGIERIDVIGNYYGYDENGDGFYTDWHRGYFVSEKQSSDPSLFDISGHVGTTTSNPGMVRWDTTWIPDQAEKAIQLIARVKDKNGYWTVTQPINGLTLYRTEPTVGFFPADAGTIKTGFGVRNGQTKSSTVTLSDRATPDNIAQAIAHIRTWNGELHGGNDPHGTFVLNGTYTGIIGGNSHFYAYTMPEITDTTVLKPGQNTFSFSSITIHHHNEILWPGPGISVRYGAEPLCPPLTPIPTIHLSPEPTEFPDVLTGILITPIVRNDNQIFFTMSNPRRNGENGEALGMQEMRVYINGEVDEALFEQNVGNRVWVRGRIEEGENFSGEYERYVVTGPNDVSFSRIQGRGMFGGAIDVNWSVIVPMSLVILLIAGTGVVISRRF